MAQSTFVNQNDLIFLLDTNNFTATITESEEASGDIFIPYSVNYNNHDYIITAIGQKAFHFSKKIKCVSFSDNSEVKSIEPLAFQFSSIIKINIPNSLTKIGSNAFFSSALESIEITPDSNLESIEELAFGSTKIKKFTIPPKLKSLQKNVFCNCILLKLIDYYPNSELYSIESNAFSSSGIETLNIPPSLEQLNGYWCDQTKFLKNIVVSPKNNFFCFSDRKYLYGKSNKDCELYDILYFVNREIEEIVIPTHIKVIGKDAISYCHKIKSVKFNENSECFCFDTYSFYNLFIESISIPKSVTVIKDDAFGKCEKLEKIEIPENSELTEIGGNVFSNTNIKSLYIPPKLAKLGKSWCNKMNTLSSFEISKENKIFSFVENKFLFRKTDINSDVFDTLCFARRDIDDKFLEIPLYTKIIAPYAFAYCRSLCVVLLARNNQLVLIDDCAFIKSSMFEIDFPSSLEKIGKKAFSENINLIYADVPNDSNLSMICERAFEITSFRYFYFPQKLELIGLKAYSAGDIQNVEFSPLINIKEIDENAFAMTLIDKIKIPSSVVVLKNSSFYSCEKLKYVEFSPDSCLERIEESVFSRNAINSISIPSSTKRIDSCAFQYCDNLKVMEILGEYHSITIKIDAFNESSSDFSIFAHKTIKINFV